MPASMSITPPGVRTTLQFPANPLAKTHSSMDIRACSVSWWGYAILSEAFRQEMQHDGSFDRSYCLG